MAWQITPDQKLVNDIEITIPRWRWIITVILDIATYALLSYRPYVSQPYQMTVIHYFGFLISTDLMAFFLSERRRIWHYAFVFVGTAGLLQATIHLWVQGLDGGDYNLSLLRVAVLTVRMINALLVIWFVGPWFQHWLALLKYAQRIFDISGPAELAALKDFARQCLVIFVLVPVAYGSHWNYGESGIDAPLTALQANVCFSLRVKLLVFTILIARPRTRGLSYIPLFLSSTLSYAIMPDMYFKAPMTFVPHVIGDIGFCKMVYDTFFKLEGPEAPFDPEAKAITSPPESEEEQ